jgi:hypothetical protein
MRTPEGKNWRLTVTVNKAQYDYIVRQAGKAGLSVSEYLRDLIGGTLKQDAAKESGDRFFDDLTG